MKKHILFSVLVIGLVFTALAANAADVEQRKIIFGNKLLTIKASSDLSEGALSKSLDKYLLSAKSLEKIFYANNSKSELFKINNMERPAYDVRVSKPMARLLSDYETLKTHLGDCFLNCERSNTNEKISESNKVQLGNMGYLELGASIDGMVVESLTEMMKKNSHLKNFSIEFGKVSAHFSKANQVMDAELVDHAQSSLLPMSVAHIQVHNEFVATGSFAGAIHPNLPYRQVSIVSDNAKVCAILAEKLSKHQVSNISDYKTFPGVKRLMIQKITGQWVDL